MAKTKMKSFKQVVNRRTPKELEGLLDAQR